MAATNVPDTCVRNENLCRLASDVTAHPCFEFLFNLLANTAVQAFKLLMSRIDIARRRLRAAFAVAIAQGCSAPSRAEITALKAV